MNELKELAQYRSDAPAPSDAARTAARSALADAILAARRTQRMLDSSSGNTNVIVFPPGRETHGRSGSIRRGVAVGVVAAAATALAFGGTLAIVGSSRHSPTVHNAKGSTTVPSKSPTGDTLRLANYSFGLPAGFKAATGPCTTSSSSGAPLTVLGGMVAAASTAGGCIEAGLAAGAVHGPPSGAQPVQVGTYQGFVSVTSATSETLYVEIPTVDGDHYLILTAVGLSAQELIDIAEAGLPGSPASSEPCSESCG